MCEIKIFFCTESNIISRINNFLKKNIKKNILIFGNNCLKRNLIVNHIIQYYFRFSKKYLPPQGQMQFYNKNYIKFSFSNKKNNLTNYLKIIDHKLSNLSKFKKNKSILILYHISNLSKCEQIKLSNLIYKYKKYFYFIVTADSLNKLSFKLKHEIFFFPISCWNFFWIKEKKVITDKKEIFVFKKNILNITKNNTIKSSFLKILLIDSIFSSLILLKNFPKILLIFFFRNLKKNNLYQNQKTQLIVEKCLEISFLKYLINFIDLKSFFLLRLNVNFTWKKTTYLIIYALYSFL